MPEPTDPGRTRSGFHVMVKPIGPVCNLDCRYCFYSEKTALFDKGENYRMSDAVLEKFIENYVAAQDCPEVPFAWQGGEPTLMGLDFFKRVVELQHKHADGKRFTNSLQTNGMLLDKEWCRFLADNGFLVGLSIDGPASVHDTYRVDTAGRPTHETVLRSLELMRRYRVEFNVLACVTRKSANKPLEVYRFFRKHGVEYIQFIPVVERLPDHPAEDLGLRLSLPPAPGARQASPNVQVTPWTVNSEAFGNFLASIFNEWIKQDVGSVFVMNFEWALASWMGIPGSTCVSSPKCGRCAVMEHNGDIYACDHYVYPEYRLGNILVDDPIMMIESQQQVDFGANKQTALTRQCRECPWLFACHGECPKHRFVQSQYGEANHSYLCAGYLRFYRHIAPYMEAMVNLLRQGEPAERIMQFASGIRERVK